MSLTDDDKTWIVDQLRTVETSLLTEFHKWPSPAEARTRSHTAAIRAIDLEAEVLSDRVKKLEDKAA
jgi:succinylglutamate desuccinylase